MKNTLRVLMFVFTIMGVITSPAFAEAPLCNAETERIRIKPEKNNEPISLSVFIRRSVDDVANEKNYEACITYYLPVEGRITEESQLPAPLCMTLVGGADKSVEFEGVTPGLYFDMFTKYEAQTEPPVRSKCHIITGADDIDGNGVVSTNDIIELFFNTGWVYYKPIN